MGQFSVEKPTAPGSVLTGIQQPKCQEVRALAVDAAVERLILQSLRPDQIALAVAALGEIESENRTMERQWTLKRERARYDAERARRQL